MSMYMVQVQESHHLRFFQMYSAVYQKFSEGGCIGIFPEGKLEKYT